jgi:hypothetical protein
MVLSQTGKKVFTRLECPIWYSPFYLYLDNQLSLNNNTAFIIKKYLRKWSRIKILFNRLKEFRLELPVHVI